MKYSEAAAQVAAEASIAAGRSKKACAGGDQERAQPALQRCRNCSRTRHNAQTCKLPIKLRMRNVSWSCQGKVAGSIVEYVITTMISEHLCDQP
jgi:hypothetical protein